MKAFFKIFNCFLLAVCLFAAAGCTPLWPFSEEACFKKFIEKTFNKSINRRPEQLTHLGIQKKQNKLNDQSQKNLEKEFKIRKKILKKLLKFDPQKLSPSSKLDFYVLKTQLERGIEGFAWRFHHYPENPLVGRSSSLNLFLITKHKIKTKKDAKNYIQRVRAFRKALHDLDQHILIANERGILPPKSILPKVRNNILKSLQGLPLASAKARPPSGLEDPSENPQKEHREEHILVKDFKKKIQFLKPKKQERLMAELSGALSEFYKPAFEKHLKVWENLKFSPHVGAWHLPRGQDYYSFTLKKYTSTHLSPDEIHKMGLREVRRLHRETEKIKNQMKFKGSLFEFLNHLRNNKKYYGTKPSQYIEQAEKALRLAQNKSPLFFNQMPRHSVEVKSTEEFRSAYAPFARYLHPSMEGERPGIYYINLHNLREQPLYTMKALTYHETIPGHHFQVSIAMDADISKFRRYSSRFTAFVEGWALYAEQIAQEMGLYPRVEDQLGRLMMELMRAIRLVVDTGIHSKKWTKQEAAQYIIQNSDSSYERALRSVERYIVVPGQAAAYTIGYFKIRDLRDRAKKELKEKWNIKEFHDQILQNGPLPLDLLEKNILYWIEEKQSIFNIL